MKLFNQVKEIIPIAVDIEALAKLHKELKWVEGEIEEINKYAKLLACGKSTSSMNFTIINTSKKTRRDKVIDSDGDLIGEDDGSRVVFTTYGMIRVNSGFGGGTTTKEANQSWNPELSPETMLRIMQIILNDKTKQKEEILNKIQKQGIKIA